MATQRPIGIGKDGSLAEMLPVQNGTGAEDAGKLVALNNAGQIDGTLLPTDNTTTFTAVETIAQGALVNLFTAAPNGPVQARNADAATGKPADGFAAAAAQANRPVPVVLREGMNGFASGLVPGASVFLGNNGAAVTNPPTAPGALLQSVGRAKSATELSFLAGVPITRAV